MASHHDIVQRVMWLKSKLSNHPLPETPKIIVLLQKLFKLPINVEVLQETGIGKCVNGLKKKCPEVASYVKPLISSWKTLVKTAMLAEQKQNDPVLENGQRSEVHEEDGSASSPPSTPGGSPCDREEDSFRTGQAFWHSPSPDEGQMSSLERNKKLRRRSSEEDVPPTPVPWSPEKKIFPPYIPRKERPEDEGASPKDLKPANDFKRVKKRDRCDGPGGAIKQRSEVKVGRSSPSKSRENFKSNLQSGERSSVKSTHHSERSSEKLKPLILKAVLDKKSQSSHSAKKRKPSTSNILLNDKISSGSHGGMKRTVPEMEDKQSKVKGQSRTSNDRESKRPSSKSTCVGGTSHLFRPDVQKAERKAPSSRKGEGPRQPGEEKRNKVGKREPISNERDDSSRPMEGKRLINEETLSQLDDRKTRTERKKKISPSKQTEEGETAVSPTSSDKSPHSGKEKRKSHAERTKVSGRSDSIRPSKTPKVIDDDRGEEEVSFESTGMSFEDCLFGGAPAVKKSKASAAGSTKTSAQKRPKPAQQDSDVPKSRKSIAEQGRRERSGERTTGKGAKEQTDRKSKKRKPLAESESTAALEKETKELQTARNDFREASASEVDQSLPDIHPDYKPTPRLPDFKPMERKKSSESMFATQWGSKQNKTKVYSGKARKRNWQSLPSLQDICKEVIYDNIDALYETGGVPFYLLEDILEKCTPQQLLKIEDYNPDYILESDHLWQKHTMRTFRGHKPDADDMESWRELYLRKRDETEYKLQAITENISASMAKKEQGRLTKLAFVDKPVKPPRNVIRQQMRHGTTSSSMPSQAPRPRKELVPGEQPSYRVIPDREPSSPVRRQRTAKVIAPMMQKSLKLMKRVNRRR